MKYPDPEEPRSSAMPIEDWRDGRIAELEAQVRRLRVSLRGFVREHGPLHDKLKYLRKALDGNWYDGEKLCAAQEFYDALLAVREHGDLEEDDGAFH